MSTHYIMSTPRRTYTTVNVIEYLTRELWYLNGQLHRINEPATRQWMILDQLGYKVPVLIIEEWYLNGKHHRTDGPAYRNWKVTDGNVTLANEVWFLHGKGIQPGILRQPVRVIERWWRFQQARRLKAIENTLWDSGMTVFPGFMSMLKEY